MFHIWILQTTTGEESGRIIEKQRSLFSRPQKQLWGWPPHEDAASHRAQTPNQPAWSASTCATADHEQTQGHISSNPISGQLMKV